MIVIVINIGMYNFIFDPQVYSGYGTYDTANRDMNKITTEFGHFHKFDINNLNIYIMDSQTFLDPEKLIDKNLNVDHFICPICLCL